MKGVLIGLGAAFALSVGGNVYLYQAYSTERTAHEFFRDRHISRIDAQTSDLNDVTAEYESAMKRVISAERRRNGKEALDSIDAVNFAAGHIRWYGLNPMGLKSQAIATRLLHGVDDRTVSDDEDTMKDDIFKLKAKFGRLQAWYKAMKSIQPGIKEPDRPK